MIRLADDLKKLRSKANGADTFSPLWLRDIQPVLDAQDFVQGLLVTSSLIVVYGQPGSGKTFWATTLALHVATGLSFAGRRVDQGGVIYCLMESGIGFRNRVSVWRDHHDIDSDDIPFVALTEHLNLRDPNGNLDSFIASVLALKQQMTAPLRLIVVDTLARAMSGGNENNPEDMGALVMSADRIRHETGAAVLLVHHSGKDESRGARGHSSLLAAIDTEIEVSHAEGQRTASVLKQRDLDKGSAFAFSLNTIKLGLNQHGETVTTCLVQFATDAVIQPLGPPLRGHQKRAFEVLTDLIARAGETGFADAPSGVSSIPEIWWRESFYERAMPGAEQGAKQRAFLRAANILVEIHRVAMNGKRVWLPDKTPDIAQTDTESGMS